MGTAGLYLLSVGGWVWAPWYLRTQKSFICNLLGSTEATLHCDRNFKYELFLTGVLGFRGVQVPDHMLSTSWHHLHEAISGPYAKFKPFERNFSNQAKWVADFRGHLSLLVRPGRLQASGRGALVPHLGLLRQLHTVTASMAPAPAGSCRAVVVGPAHMASPPWRPPWAPHQKMSHSFLSVHAEGSKSLCLATVLSIYGNISRRPLVPSLNTSNKLKEKVEAMEVSNNPKNIIPNSVY